MFTITVSSLSPTKKTLLGLCQELESHQYCQGMKLEKQIKPFGLTVTVPYRTLQVIEDRAQKYGFDVRVSQ